MENGFSSPRSDAFPAGLRVLVVDDDPTWLKILEKMLKKCSYEVTTCGLAREALNLLRERKDGYDIVISDVNMPDMDGFKLLEHVGLEMDLPVIMMSVDGETSRVMKGVQHGACDYLLKPIRMKELRNIWQHVLRKKIHEVREIESHDCFEGMFGQTGSEQSEDGQFLRGEDMSSTLLKKRKDFDKHDEKDIGDASSMKKSRVVWSVDLHQKFVKAVDQIGFQRVGPKKILDLMKVPWLTRENVASHLQKYRLYLSRLQKQNDGKSCGMGMKPFDVSSNAPTPTSCLQNTLHMNQTEAQNFKHALPGNSFPLQKVDTKGLERNLQRIVSEPAPELKRAMSSSPTDSNNTWKMKFSHSELNFAASQQTQIEALETQLKAESKTLVPLKSDFIDIPLTNPQSNFQVDQLHSISSISSRPSIGEAEITSSITTVALNKVQYLFDSFPAQHGIDEVNHLFEPPSSTTSIGMKKQELIESCLLETGRGLHSDLFDNDMQVCWLQEDCIVKNLGQNIDFTDCKDSGVITDYIGHDYWYDPTEYILIDDGMFTS